MDKKELISYAVHFNGEYREIIRAIELKKSVPEVEVENAITVFDDVYPSSLFDLKYPPLVLFYKGDLTLLENEMIGVVGSRKPCEYALKATKGLVRNYRDEVIISGLAKGIDACAHENASKTIGILGCGIDYIYPFSNYELFKRMERSQLIISEYPGMCKPLSYHFPFRNRIIAALSKRVYVMQSKERSGTMTTVNECLEMGKEVRVLPYAVFDEDGRHNNHLIYEGATPILIDEIAF
ncbi:MAG: DNA-protecting protein DprA [Erysipelotrichaceae bacterium]|nr:DNA-protecting protein DprA [Erysipelotrichaceae bacterium]